MVDRREERREALLEWARYALAELEQQLDEPGGSRVVGEVDGSADPESLRIRLEVPIDGWWVTLVNIGARQLGMTDEEIDEETRLVLDQSEVGIPDDTSQVDPASSC